MAVYSQNIIQAKDPRKDAIHYLLTNGSYRPKFKILYPTCKLIYAQPEDVGLVSEKENEVCEHSTILLEGQRETNLSVPQLIPFGVKGAMAAIGTEGLPGMFEIWYNVTDNRPKYRLSLLIEGPNYAALPVDARQGIQRDYVQQGLSLESEHKSNLVEKVTKLIEGAKTQGEEETVRAFLSDSGLWEISWEAWSQWWSAYRVYKFKK